MPQPSDDIVRAVESAINAGMSAKQFIIVAWDAWEDALDDKKKRDMNEFKAAVNNKAR